MSECLIATISREYLSLSPLRIGGTGDPIQFDGASNAANALEWSGERWDRQMVDSPWVHGDRMVAARRSGGTVRLGLWIVGADFPVIRAAFDQLAAALSQWTYTLTVKTGPVDYTMRGWTADYALGFTRHHLHALAAPAAATVPVLPLGAT